MLGAGPVPDPFRIFSKYTPANPEQRELTTTAMKPRNGFCVSEATLFAPRREGWSCTIAIPAKRKKRDNL